MFWISHWKLNPKLILNAKKFWSWIVKETTLENYQQPNKNYNQNFQPFSLFEGEAEVAAVEAVVAAVEDAVATKEATEATAA